MALRGFSKASGKCQKYLGTSQKPSATAKRTRQPSKTCWETCQRPLEGSRNLRWLPRPLENLPKTIWYSLAHCQQKTLFNETNNPGPWIGQGRRETPMPTTETPPIQLFDNTRQHRIKATKITHVLQHSEHYEILSETQVNTLSLVHEKDCCNIF